MPDTTSPQLTEDQLAFYHENGYVIVPGVFEASELDHINAELDQALQRKDAPSNHRGWLLSLAQQSELAGKVCEDDRLLDMIEPLVYPGISIYSAKLTTKEPHDEEVCHWHQDDAYYTRHSQSDCRLSVYIALQDIDPEMGCLQVIPGSHKQGLLEAEAKDFGTCRLAMTREPDLSRAIYVPMKAGDVLIFSALLHHGSGGNPTNRRRRAFIVSYQQADAKGNAEQWKVLRPAAATAPGPSDPRK